MFQSIVVAVDGSSHAGRAIDVATTLARAHGSKLTIVHAKQPGPIPEHLIHMYEAEHLVDAGTPSPNMALDFSGNLGVAQRGGHAVNEDRAREVLAERLVKNASQSAREAGVNQVETCINQGYSGDAILDCARQQKADLIVMGRRGLSNFKGLLMGSVTHKVSQRAGCACLTIT